jgi:hypothetical protein
LLYYNEFIFLFIISLNLIDMKNKVLYFMIMLFSFTGITHLKAQSDITLTITLDVAFDMNTQVVTPATVYDNINVAIAAAFDALGGGETLETHGQYVKKLILKGSAPYSHYDLRGIRNTFCSGLTATATTFNSVEEIDMSEALLVNDKLQSPLQWSTNKYTENNYASIEAGAFGYTNTLSPNLKKIIFPPTLKNIGSKVFGRCKSLEAIELPESLKGIGIDAFNSCAKLTFPNGLPVGMEGNLGAGAFNGCSNLELTELPPNISITGDCGEAFMGCAKITFTALNSKKNGTTDGSKDFYPKNLFKNSGVSISQIPETADFKIYQISEGAFENCANIDTLIFPASFASQNSRIKSKIGSRAFALPNGSTVQRTYIFEAEIPPVDGVAADAFNKGTAVDPGAIVYVPNAAAEEAFKAVAPFDQMNVTKIINTITVEAGEHGIVTTTYGTIADNGTIDVKKGDDITFSFSANYGYEIVKVSVNDEEIELEDDATYTLSVATVDQDYSIAVEYDRNVFTITVNAGEYGAVTTAYGEITDGSIEVNKGDEIVFTVTPDENYHVAAALLDGSPVTLTEESAYTLPDVEDDHTFSVTFTIITAIKSTGGESCFHYPNPTVDILNIDGLKKGTTIRLYNQMGILLVETRKTAIDLSTYAKGVYFVKINNEVKKLIKK